jgi:type IV pilus assembly protein PilB
VCEFSPLVVDGSGKRVGAEVLVTMSAKLGESLLKDNLITPQQLKEALDYQRINGGRLASTLVKLCMLSDEEVTAVLSRQYGVPSVNLDLFEVDPAAVALVPQETSER